jgi:hypothetical protein
MVSSMSLGQLADALVDLGHGAGHGVQAGVGKAEDLEVGPWSQAESCGAPQQRQPAATVVGRAQRKPV